MKRRLGWHVRGTPIIVFTAVVSMAVPLPVRAQVHQPVGRLHGTIFDESGAVLPGSEVILRSDTETYSASTRAVGTYDIELPTGIYQMNVVKPGFCYRRASFRMATAPLTINAYVPTCAIAQVATIADGMSTVRDELRPSFSEQEVSIPGQDLSQLKLLITYRNRDKDADITTYSGYVFSGATSRVIVTYDCLTIYATKVRFDHRALRMYAEGGVTIEDGRQSSISDQATVRFENGKAVVQPD